MNKLTKTINCGFFCGGRNTTEAKTKPRNAVYCCLECDKMLQQLDRQRVATSNTAAKKQ